MFKNKNNNRKHKNITVDTEFGTFKISIENMATKYCTNKQLILKLTTQLLRSLQSKNGIPQIWKNKFCCCLLISLNSDSKCTLKLIRSTIARIFRIEIHSNCPPLYLFKFQTPASFFRKIFSMMWFYAKT